MDLVYLQRDQSFCTGQTVSSPPLQVLPFVLCPYCKAAGVSLQIMSYVTTSTWIKNYSLNHKEKKTVAADSAMQIVI